MINEQNDHRARKIQYQMLRNLVIRVKFAEIPEILEYLRSPRFTTRISAKCQPEFHRMSYEILYNH